MEQVVGVEKVDQSSKSKKNKAKEYLKGWISYRIKRYWAYMIATVVALGMPWITINENHLFLLSFDHKKLHLAGVAFDMQELYLMPFLLMLLFLGIFAVTAVGGRAWCGWACPQTIFRVVYRDFIETKLLGLRKRIKNKQQEPDMSKLENKIKKIIAIVLWSSLSIIAAADFMWYFVPPEEFFTYLQYPADHMVMIGFVLGVALFLVVDIVFIKEDFCIYICPYSRVQSVLYDDDTLMAIYDPIRGGGIYEGHGNDRHKAFNKQKELKAIHSQAECTTCESCVTVCPTHIDIRKGLQLECINCLECVDACTQVMGALGKPSLVQWSSVIETEKHERKTKIFRPKVIAYFTILTIVLVALFAMGSKKEHMLLNINKTTRLYKILDGGVVENDYIFLFANTDSKRHTYYFEIEEPLKKKIHIVRPKNSFSIASGKKRKKVVVLRTNIELADSTRKDVPIPVTIKAYAIDDKEKVVVTRHTVFVYPRADLLKK
ncbi:MAG: cytochrome c oxidase accessory protein CcoG [Sulfurovum sp.]|nr:cytochrome c oxidase accessory protein CcoG [Sulfurovum sp.]MCB4749182.1 cytochrome c oxidase accessory protein CcoG [Sulfurovum sp.]MCB4766358.1 cytochrome c oxidase accessory protein CcoG [Sulfurovum sp.]MCB4773804.1 cytochrome c oxidase accessory protein CcoG [Sulfurovum sp.]MCB4776860.1 cytochrome c oxidase accessory protein CcoG [Sulfurovum sp.]